MCSPEHRHIAIQHSSDNVSLHRVCSIPCNSAIPFPNHFDTLFLPLNIQYVHGPNVGMRPIIPIVRVRSHRISISFEEAMQSRYDRLHDAVLMHHPFRDIADRRPTFCT